MGILGGKKTATIMVSAHTVHCSHRRESTPPRAGFVAFPGECVFYVVPNKPCNQKYFKSNQNCHSEYCWEAIRLHVINQVANLDIQNTVLRAFPKGWCKFLGWCDQEGHRHVIKHVYASFQVGKMLQKWALATACQSKPVLKKLDKLGKLGLRYTWLLV